jgi:hypothetical protein
MNGPWSIETADGHVTLRLARDFAANLEARSGDGHISVDLPSTSRAHFSKGFFHPEDMRFANSDALSPPAELAKLISAEVEGQCKVLCYGPCPPWVEIQAASSNSGNFCEAKRLLRALVQNRDKTRSVAAVGRAPTRHRGLFWLSGLFWNQ